MGHTGVLLRFPAGMVVISANVLLRQYSLAWSLLKPYAAQVAIAIAQAAENAAQQALPKPKSSSEAW